MKVSAPHGGRHGGTGERARPLPQLGQYFVRPRRTVPWTPPQE
ncbi:hypothetical protein AB0O76_08600 [Streptomyces sp. NPDC086554]